MTTWKKSEKEIIKHRACPGTELVWALVCPSSGSSGHWFVGHWLVRALSLSGHWFVWTLVCPSTELVRALSLSKCHLHKQFH